jgi:hypothetical protein
MAWNHGCSGGDYQRPDAPLGHSNDLNQYGNMMQEPMRLANSKVVQMALKQRAI